MSKRKAAEAVAFQARASELNPDGILSCNLAVAYCGEGRELTVKAMIDQVNWLTGRKNK